MFDHTAQVLEARKEWRAYQRNTAKRLKIGKRSRLTDFGRPEDYIHWQEYAKEKDLSLERVKRDLPNRKYASAKKYKGIWYIRRDDQAKALHAMTVIDYALKSGISISKAREMVANGKLKTFKSPSGRYYVQTPLPPQDDIFS